MKITRTGTETEVTLQVSGRLDTVTAPELCQVVTDLGQEVKMLVLDFEGLEYISSAGIRAVLTSQKKMSKQGELKLCHLCPTVQEVFDLTGFSDILTIE